MGLLVIVVLLFFLIIIPRPKRLGSGGPTINFCNDGMEGHERRVAEFYGDDYDEIVSKRNKRFAYWDKMEKAGNVEEYTVMIDGREFKCKKLMVKDLENI